MKDKEPATELGTNQSSIHKVPGWVKSARHTTRKRQPDASWQRVLAETALNKALDLTPILRAALYEAFIQVFNDQPSVHDAVMAAFNPVDNEERTSFHDTTLAGVLVNAAYALNNAKLLTPDGERLTEAFMQHLLHTHGVLPREQDDA